MTLGNLICSGAGFALLRLLRASPLTLLFSYMLSLFDLAVVTPRTALMLPVYDDLQSLLSLAAGKIVPPEPQPGWDFVGEWAQVPPPQFQENFILQQWRVRNSFSPESWALSLALLSEGGLPMGMITAWGHNFLQNRSARIAFWTLPEWRGQGLSKEAHRGMLQLLFQGLGAQEVWLRHHPADAISDHIASSLGYLQGGLERAEDNRGIEMVRRSLPRSAWRPVSGVEIVGLESSLSLFGLSGSQAPEQ